MTRKSASPKTSPTTSPISNARSNDAANTVSKIAIKKGNATMKEFVSSATIEAGLTIVKTSFATMLDVTPDLTATKFQDSTIGASAGHIWKSKLVPTGANQTCYVASISDAKTGYKLHTWQICAIIGAFSGLKSHKFVMDGITKSVNKILPARTIKMKGMSSPYAGEIHSDEWAMKANLFLACDFIARDVTVTAQDSETGAITDVSWTDRPMNIQGTMKNPILTFGYRGWYQLAVLNGTLTVVEIDIEENKKIFGVDSFSYTQERLTRMTELAMGMPFYLTTNRYPVLTGFRKGTIDTRMENDAENLRAHLLDDEKTAIMVKLNKKATRAVYASEKATMSIGIANGDIEIPAVPADAAPGDVTPVIKNDFEIAVFSVAGKKVTMKKHSEMLTAKGVYEVRENQGEGKVMTQHSGLTGCTYAELVAKKQLIVLQNIFKLKGYGLRLVAKK